MRLRKSASIVLWFPPFSCPESSGEILKNYQKIYKILENRNNKVSKYSEVKNSKEKYKKCVDK